MIFFTLPTYFLLLCCSSLKAAAPKAQENPQFVIKASIIIAENEQVFGSYQADGYELRTHDYVDNDDVAQSEKFYYKLSDCGRVFIASPNNPLKLPQDIKSILDKTEVETRNRSKKPNAFQLMRNKTQVFTLEDSLADE